MLHSLLDGVLDYIDGQLKHCIENYIKYIKELSLSPIPISHEE